VRFQALRADPEARSTFLTRNGVCPLPGWTLRQPELGRTLRALTDPEHPTSWDEQVGAKMVTFLAEKGSRMSPADLQGVTVTSRLAVEGRFLGHRIVSMGPPSSGGVLVIALLQIYERLRQRLPDASFVHLWVEASRLVFYDRAALLGDPDFVPVPTDRLVSSAYADEQAKRVTASGAVPLPTSLPAKESRHTTHFSVVDPDGLAIALTQTINVPFGAALVVPGTGVLLNDEMDDFYLEGPNAFGLVGNERNAPQPGKRPLSSMSPTFVFDGDRLMLVLGSPGGSSIPTAVAWVIREILEAGVGAEEAVRAPRVHHQWVPDVLEVEPRFDRSLLPPELKAGARPPPFPIGRVQLTVNDQDGWRAVSDCRDDGASWTGGR
jgi:gamma-glutamyltranspeptidase/glutathione hydrolase